MVEEKKTTVKETETEPKKAAPTKKKEAEVKAAPKKEAAPKKTPEKKAETEKKTVKTPAVKSRLEVRYREEIVPALIKEFKYTSVMQVPAIKKIVVNMGVGDATANSKLLDDAAEELKLITGQVPVITKAKKSIANFKLREGHAIGTKVTLRGKRMYDFLDKLITIALPRVRDFRGVSKNAFDGRGNYTLGVKEQLIFPEINYDKINKIRGMDIVIVTSAKTDKEAYTLLQLIGMPFKK